MIADGWLDQDFRTSNGNNAEIQFPHPPQNLEYTSQILKNTQKKKKKKRKIPWFESQPKHNLDQTTGQSWRGRMGFRDFPILRSTPWEIYQIEATCMFKHESFVTPIRRVNITAIRYT
jgi:hypothetical protein